MIVAETEHCVRFVTQPDHADLAGQFADHWGNDRFDRPWPEAPVAIAAYNHDTGWWRYDRRPRLGTDGRPLGFRDIPVETWTEIYDEGVETVAEVDPYAGLLVSLHGVGLRRQRYGLSPSWPETPPECRPFLERQEDRQARLAGRLRDTGRLSTGDAELLSELRASGTAPAAPESRLWENYRLLQAWDTLSLAFCETASPPGYSRLPAVPADGGAADRALSVAPLEDGVGIDPYPFDSSPLGVSVSTRTVPKGVFDSEDGLVRAYYRAERELEEFTVRRPG